MDGVTGTFLTLAMLAKNERNSVIFPLLFHLLTTLRVCSFGYSFNDLCECLWQLFASWKVWFTCEHGMGFQ